MKVEILGKRLSSADPKTGTHYSLAQGDTVTVSDACGQLWCDRGWAKDTSGQYPTGERKPGAQKLTVHSGKVGGKRNG